MSKYALIGMMGSGKSTLGQALAAKLKLDFIDLDWQIEIKQKKSVLEIFLEYGEDYFRQLETECLQSLYNSKQDHFVLATGGGCFLSAQNREILRGLATINIYLQCDLQTLVQRTQKNTWQRPLLCINNSELSIQQQLQNLLSQREKDYLKADIIFRNNHSDLDNALSSLVTQIHDWQNNHY